MQIAEAADQSGLTQDTIRFYEKSGMLPPIARDTRGWRHFSGEDLSWLTILERLRSTGMPLDDIKRFASSAHAPDSDSDAQCKIRLSILERHAETLAKRRSDLELCETYLRGKIQTYRNMGL